MMTSVRVLVSAALLTSLLSLRVLAQEGAGFEETDVCEIVSVTKTAISDDNPNGLEVISKSADDFLLSVYDDEPGFVKMIDGKRVKAVFCTRVDVIPTLRDFPVLATGLPFSISQDLTSSDSPVLTLYYKQGAFQYHYSGPDLTDIDQARLDDVVEIFNLQPHNLDEG